MRLKHNNQSTPSQQAQAFARRRRGETEWRSLAMQAAIAVVVLVALLYFKPEFTRTTIVFLITLGVLVFVHEWGHYQFALWAGMKVNRFGIGFPPWILTKRHNDIDYSIGALPLGGMVDIAGLGSEEEMVAATKEKAASVSGRETIDGTRIVKEDIPESEGKDTFEHYRLRNPDAPHGQKQFQDASLGWRFITLFAGPLMNFLFAIVAFIGVYSIVGVPDPEKTTTINHVEAVRHNSPAYEAGIQSGDYLIAINGKATTQTKELSDLIRASKGQPITVTVKRGDQILQKQLTPQVQEVGIPGVRSEKAYAIGVEFELDIVNRKVGLGEAASTGFAQAFGISYQIVSLLGRAVTFQMSPEERSGVGGPVKIAEATGRFARKGFAEAVIFAGLLSVNLGLLNLLPFPALDGGRILFLAYELVARKPFDPRKEGIVHAVGMAVLLAFMLFITVRDVLPFIERGLSGS